MNFATLTMALLALTAFSACAWGELKVEVTTNRQAYTSGQPIVMTLKIVNAAKEPVTLSFPTSQRYDFILEDGQGKEAWRWSANRVFLMVLGQEMLDEKRKELIYSETFPGRLAAGRYLVKGKVVSRPKGYEASAVIQIQ